jgi:hypothetical protein
MKSSFHSLNSFLDISQSPSTAIPRTRPNSRQQLIKINSSSTELSQLLTTDCSLGTSRYIASGRIAQETLSSIVPYCFACLLICCLTIDVFSESLPSNVSTRHYIHIYTWYVQKNIIFIFFM